jgi:D-arabinose 1-dehydrogenase-like Zn-dependent alcohol dehydrogenase
MCAGQTVWLPFARTDIRPWHTVGIVGMGGLGHLAIQFAAKMGCEVIVFSGSDSKKAEAMRLGASAFWNTYIPNLPFSALSLSTHVYVAHNSFLQIHPNSRYALYSLPHDDLRG